MICIRCDNAAKDRSFTNMRLFEDWSEYTIYLCPDCSDDTWDTHFDIEVHEVCNDCWPKHEKNFKYYSFSPSTRIMNRQRRLPSASRGKGGIRVLGEVSHP